MVQKGNKSMKKYVKIAVILAVIMAAIPAAVNLKSFVVPNITEQSENTSIVTDASNESYDLPENLTFLDGESTVTRSAKSLIYSLVGAAVGTDFTADEVKSLTIVYHTYLCRENDNGTLSIDTSDSGVYLNESALKEKFGDSLTTLRSYSDNVYTELIMADGELCDIQSAELTANPYITLAGDYSTTLTFSEEDFCEKISEISTEADISENPRQIIGGFSYNDDGTVNSVVIGGAEISGDSIAQSFGLPSTKFTLVYSLEEFQFTTAYPTVSAGLTAYAAHMMAEQGNTYEEIVNYYYL